MTKKLVIPQFDETENIFEKSFGKFGPILLNIFRKNWLRDKCSG